MVNKSYAYAETLEVLQHMDKKYIEQIPIKFINMLKNESQKNYINHLDRKH